MLTKAGREFIRSPAQVWAPAVVILASADGVAAAALEMLALCLLEHRSRAQRSVVLEEVAALLAAEGYRSETTGARPSVDDVAWLLADSLRLLELLRMIVASGDWGARRLELSAVGGAMLWALLRVRATAPLAWESQ